MTESRVVNGQVPSRTTSVPSCQTTLLAVCGAHLDGEPLNPFLLELGATLIETARTAPIYRMVLLPARPGSPVPDRPGLIRTGPGPATSGSIEVELYELPVDALGPLMMTVSPPLAIGTVLLDDGREPLGFVCEGYAAIGHRDITSLGNWRAYRALPAR